MNPEGVKLMSNRNLKEKSHDGRILKNVLEEEFPNLLSVHSLRLFFFGGGREI